MTQLPVSDRLASTVPASRHISGLTMRRPAARRLPVKRVSKNVGGIRARAGRRAPTHPEHYMTAREARALAKEIEANLAAKNPCPTPAACPMQRPRRAGFQELSFRNFAQMAENQARRREMFKDVDWSLSNNEIARQLDVSRNTVGAERKRRGIAPSHASGYNQTSHGQIASAERAKRSDYSTVDWSLPNDEIAANLRVSVGAVCLQRAKLCR